MLKPLNNYVLIEVLENELAKDSKNQIPTGLIVAFSDSITNIKIGEKVIYSRNSGEYINYQSRAYLMIPYQDLIAILE